MRGIEFSNGGGIVQQPMSVLNKVLRTTLLVMGISITFGVQMQRLSGLFSGLSGDDVGYNYTYLDANSFHALRHNADWLMRPVLDFTLRKWLWFSLLTPSELSLALVSWIYAGASLILLLAIPWTSFIELQVLGVALLGFCNIERLYSTQAQGYSFVSFSSWILIYSFLGACCWIDEKGRRRASIALFVFALGLCLNAHFFAWPLAAVLACSFYIYIREHPTLNKAERKLALARLSIGISLVFLVTVLINLPELKHLFAFSPLKTSACRFQWKGSLFWITQSWRWIEVPQFIFLFMIGLGLLHPTRSKRYLSWALAIAILAVKYILVLGMMAKSSYPISDRYLLSFLAPSIAVYLLGAESLLLWLKKGVKSRIAVNVLALTILFVNLWRLPIARLGQEAIQGVNDFQRTPANYSSRYQFFDKVKSYKKPALVLTNDCWLSSIPDLYLRYLGPSSGSIPNVTFNTMDSCETSPDDRSAGISTFMIRYGNDGVFVAFDENVYTDKSPCATDANYLYRHPVDACEAIYSVRSLKTQLLSRYILKNTNYSFPRESNDHGDLAAVIKAVKKSFLHI